MLAHAFEGRFASSAGIERLSDQIVVEATRRPHDEDGLDRPHQTERTLGAAFENPCRSAQGFIRGSQLGHLVAKPSRVPTEIRGRREPLVTLQLLVYQLTKTRQSGQVARAASLERDALSQVGKLALQNN